MFAVLASNSAGTADEISVGCRGTITRALTAAGLFSYVLCGQEYQFRYFGVSDGLTNMAVRKIFQDRVGFLWVSTENGIFRYDGERFEAFGRDRGMPVNSGAALGEAPDGALLVGGSFGLYHLAGNRFEQIPIASSQVSWAQGIQSDAKGHTFIGTDLGLIELSRSAMEPAQFDVRRLPQAAGASGPAAYGVLVDGDTLWYGCGTELCRTDKNGTVVLGRESGLSQSAWLVIRKDGDGNLWVRAKDGGVFVRLRGEARFKHPNTLVAPGALVGVMSVDLEGHILLPSSNGLLIANGKGWRNIDRSAGLRGVVYSAFEDRQRALWIGLAGRGLARWGGYGEWEKYTSDGGLPNDLVYEILPLANRSLWIATESGLFLGKAGRRGIEWAQAPGVSRLPVHTVKLAPDGDLWIGTESNGAARIDTHTHQVKWFGESEGLAAKAPYTLRFDRKHQLWAATEAGLFVSKPPYRRFSRIVGLPSTRFWTIAEGADGRIWAGGTSGLFEYSGADWRKYTDANGLSNQEVIALGSAPDGTMWVGFRFGGGIDHVRPSATGAKIERSVQRLGTLGIVYFLNFDAKGRLWAGTERGVDVWDGARWSHYDSNDGLAWDDCNLNAFAAEPDGSVWIGTSGGLSRFNPRPSGVADLSPKVVFARLVLGRVDVSGQQNPSAEIHSNALTARYSALNARQTSDVVFRYRLMPTNVRWTETLRRELEFAELPPGAYRLEVEARDSDGAWGAQGAAFPFVILTPWYRTWWFLAVCVSTPVLLIGCGVRWRMMAARRRESELVRIVESKTADLQRANENLLLLSSLDPLTGLANRRAFDVRLSDECARFRRTGCSVSLIILDVDCFKALNDSEGHQRGDEYLTLIGSELRRLARREVDVAARYGGEEFALILPETNEFGAMRVAESVREAIASLGLPHLASSVAAFLTVSVGVSTAIRESYCTPFDLISAADQALYRAKRNGRNRTEFAEHENLVPRQASSSENCLP